MRQFAIVPILMLLFLAACKEELPPSPPPPGGEVGRAIAGMAAGMPAWASEAKNVAVTPEEAFFNDGIIVSVGNFDYIYSNGYVFNSKTRTWEKFSLQGEKVDAWLKNTAIGSVTVDSARFAEGNNYVVVYACSKVAGKWDCNDKKWMLAKFTVRGSATGRIPEMANIDQFVINAPINPFTVMSTLAEKDNFGDVNVIRYDAKYRETAKRGLVVLVHVFDFNNRQDLDKSLQAFFKDIINNGWKQHAGHNLALFLSTDDHRIAVWSSGKVIVYVETFEAESANKEIIEAYLKKYPSDLKKIP
ncbi:MAG: hypothetical protein QW165_01925 [Candidatus Woesearchaeota archaeon]